MVMIISTSEVLNLKAPSKFAVDNSQFLFLFFKEKRTWHFMYVVCQSDDSHEMLSLIYSEKYKKQTIKQIKTIRMLSAAVMIGTLGVKSYFNAVLNQ